MSKIINNNGVTTALAKVTLLAMAANLAKVDDTV